MTQSAIILLANNALPCHPIATETIQIKRGTAQPPTQVTVRRVDSDHADVKQHWLEMGLSEYLSAAAITELSAVSRGELEPHPFASVGRMLGFDLILLPLSVAAVTFGFVESDHG